MTRAIRPLAFALLSAACLSAQIKLPAYNRRVLPNGVTLYVMRRAGVPLVDIDIAVKGGKESEPAALPGLAEVTADLLRKGTASYSAASFSEVLDALGGSYRSSTDPQMTVFETEFLAKDFAEGLSLVAGSVLHPTFPDEEVVKLLGERRDDVKALKDNPARAISPYAHTYFFGKAHPYGRIIDEESVSRITRPAIDQYYKRMYVAENLVVAVVGDVDPSLASQEVERAFRQAPANPPYRWMEPAKLPDDAAYRLLLVDKPGATQTYFYIMQPSIEASNPDRVAIRVVNVLFGGRFTSMLNEELRVKTGLTYGAHSTVEMDRLQGMNAIETFTKTDSTAKAVELSLSTLKAFRANGITAAQLASAKAYLKGTLPQTMIETSDQIARELIRLDVLGLDRTEIDDLFQRIDTVTLDQANGVVRKYYRTEGLTFVLIGDAAKIRGQLADFPAKVREVGITKPGFGYESN
jgi:predicted Zn-dependent peptidase